MEDKKKGTTLARLAVGDKFEFGGVVFKVSLASDNEAVSCFVGDTGCIVSIMEYAWVLKID